MEILVQFQQNATKLVGKYHNLGSMAIRYVFQGQ